MSDDEKTTMAKYTFAMKNDYILARRIAMDVQKRSSGLYVPSRDDQRDPQTGKRECEGMAEVLFVGEGAVTDTWDAEAGAFRRRTPCCKAGDLIITMGTWYSVVMNGEPMILGQNYNVVCVLTPAEEAAGLVVDEPEPSRLVVVN